VNKHEFGQGVRTALPIGIGYFPYGIAYGLIAKQCGLDLAQILFMSLTIYAGTSQFVMVGMMAALSPLFSMVFTVFMINSRYLLINSALLPIMREWKPWKRFLVAFYVSDETFVVLSKQADKEKLNEHFALGVNAIALACWLVSNVIGFLAGNYLDLNKLGFDFALTAVLVALATLMIKNKVSLVVGICSGLLAVALYFAGLQKMSILLAAIIASTLGVVYTWKQTRSI